MDTRFEIVSDFFIGLSISANNHNLNNLYGTKKVIDCSVDLSYLEKYREYTDAKHRQMLYHQEQTQFMNYILQTCETIYQTILQNESILVCCKDCTQISPTIALVFLVKYAKMSMRDALRSILSKVSTHVFQPNILYYDTIKPFL